MVPDSDECVERLAHAWKGLENPGTPQVICAFRADRSIIGVAGDPVAGVFQWFIWRDQSRLTTSSAAYRTPEDALRAVRVDLVGEIDRWLARREAASHLTALAGSVPDFPDIPRRRADDEEDMAIARKVMSDNQDALRDLAK